MSDSHIAEALSLATQPVGQYLALLRPAHHLDNQPERYLVVDALLARETLSHPADRIVIEALRHHAQTHLALAKEAEATGRWEDAEAAYRDAIGTGHPEEAPLAMFNLGVLLQQRGRWEKAEEAYREAIATGHPDHAPRPTGNLGVLLNERGRWEEAEAAWREVIRTGHPDQAPRAMFNLGVLQQRGRWEEAEAAYRQAIATRHPEEAPAAMINLGNMLHERGRWEEAEGVMTLPVAISRAANRSQVPLRS